MNVRAHILVSGRVQGVFFRSETRYEAERRGVTGWVRNLSDARVEAVLEGDKKSVKEVIDFCRKGPSLAIVKNVQVEWEDYTGEFEDFKIRYTLF